MGLSHNPEKASTPIMTVTFHYRSWKHFAIQWPNKTYLLFSLHPICGRLLSPKLRKQLSPRWYIIQCQSFTKTHSPNCQMKSYLQVSYKLTEVRNGTSKCKNQSVNRGSEFAALTLDILYWHRGQSGIGMEKSLTSEYSPK